MTFAARQSLIVTAVALGIFGASSWLSSLAPLGPTGHQVLLKALLLAASFAAMATWRPSGADWGLRRASNIRWFRVIAPALALGAVASGIVLAGGGKGLQTALGLMKFWQLVLVIWFWSSLSEEVFTRGWLQGALHRFRDRTLAGRPLPAVISGLVFGAMHISLFFKGADAITATVIVLSATTLGLWAGVLRERFNSIAPPLAAHIAFNIGGVIGGALFVITYRLTTGHFPPQTGLS